MNSTLSAIVGILIILGVGGLVFWQERSQPAVPGFSPSATSDMRPGGGSGTSAGSESVNLGAWDDDDNDDENDDNGGAGPTSAGSSTASGSQTTSISSAEVAKHNSRASCWSSINGSVYDLTSWVPEHPGGEQAILQLCGADGSAKFNRQHGGAPQQAAILAGFKIGTLQ